MTASANRPPSRKARSASGSPNLPAGFTDTFTSQYVGTAELVGLDSYGPGEIIRQVREAEAREGVATDDATIVCRS